MSFLKRLRDSAKRPPSLRWPSRTEKVLITLATLALFLHDITINKVHDFGLDRMVHVFNSVPVPAIVLTYAAMIIYTALIIAIMLVQVKVRNGINFYDFVMGTLMVFGWLMVFAESIISIYHPLDFAVPFFNTQLPLIDFRHIGIGAQILGLIYYSVTEAK